MPNIGPLELTLILLIVVLLFGAKRLPDTAKSVGQSLKIFKKSIREDDDPAATEPPRQVTSATDPVPPAPVPPAQPHRQDDTNRTD